MSALIAVDEPIKDGSKIQWTDYTFNPWWGCTKVSAACRNCYAETFAKRTGHDVWGAGGERWFLSEANWRKPMTWAKRARAAGVRRRVFCASMADLFERHANVDSDTAYGMDTARAQAWELIEETADALDWLLLTKRPENIIDMTPQRWRGGRAPHAVWLGATMEDQSQARWRSVALRGAAMALGAPITFASYEPGLGPVQWRRLGETGAVLRPGDAMPRWLIIGGESGAKARPFDLRWARSALDACAGIGVPAFVKQLGARPVDASGPRLDLAGKNRKGDDTSLWPEWLRVRQFPEVRR